MALAAQAVLGSCAAGTYLRYRIAPDYPRDRSETLALPGLRQPVQVFLDAAGTPHIDAESEEDLLRAVGFMQARSRFFQMDMIRRMARGQLSELVGERRILSSTTVEFDRSMRGGGFDALCREDAKGLDPQTRSLMKAYTEGINTAVARYKPIEHRLIGVEPEPWTLEDCFAVGHLNAWSVSHNWHQETSRLLLALHAGIDRAEKIYGSEPWPGGTTLAAKGGPGGLLPAIAPELRSLFPERPYRPEDGESKHVARGLEADLSRFSGASNAWVVGGRRSASGKPLLANDPHLVHLLPSLLFQQHLRCPGMDVIGVTLPGVPYVLAGHNHHVAWGMTASVGDVMDLYVEQPNPRNSDEVLGLHGFEPIESAEVIVRVRQGSKVEERHFTLRRTRHGPLLNDIFPDLFPSWAPPISLCWDVSGTAQALKHLSRAARAGSVEELQEALSLMSTSLQTWTAADTEGRIAVFVNGRVPVRKRHLGTFPAPGWVAEYDWRGFADASMLPQGRGGEEDFFAHANNLMIDPAHSSTFFNVDSAPSYRFDRITELLRLEEHQTPQSFAKIQGDILLLRAQNLLSHMLKDLESTAEDDPIEKKAYSLLNDWNGEARADAAAPAIFFLTYREAIIEALRDEVDSRGLEFILSQRYSTNAFDGWLASADHIVWDDRGTPDVEARAGVVQQAFQVAVAQLRDTQGKDPSAWRWGRLHDLHIQHVIGSQRLLAGFVNLPWTEAPGASASVWKSHFDLGHPQTPFRAMAGPVSRMIVDTADIHHGWWILDTGVSGWPGSPHYGDQHELWKRGDYLPMVSNWEEVEAGATAVLTLIGDSPSG